MIYNATITSIASPTSNAGGKILFGAATTLDLGCALVDVTARHRHILGATIKDATAVLYLLKADVPSSITLDPIPGQKVIASVDDSPGGAKSYRIVHVSNAEKSGGLSHWEMFLQELLA